MIKSQPLPFSDGTVVAHTHTSEGPLCSRVLLTALSPLLILRGLFVILYTSSLTGTRHKRKKEANLLMLDIGVLYLTEDGVSCASYH